MDHCEYNISVCSPSLKWFSHIMFVYETSHKSDNVFAIFSFLTVRMIIILVLGSLIFQLFIMEFGLGPESLFVKVQQLFSSICHYEVPKHTVKKKVKTSSLSITGNRNRTLEQ